MKKGMDAGMEELKKRVCRWIESQEQSAVTLLQQVVQERSIQGEEASAQAIILEKCRQLGLAIDLWEPSKKLMESHPHFFTVRNHFKNSPNIVALLKGCGNGKSIILNGHIDVVPEGDLEQWEHDPYKAEIEDGKVYGRGTTDMKGGNIAMLMAIEAIKENDIKLKGDIIFQSVIEEESGGAGTLAAILRGYKADGAIIPEPTNMKIFTKQQGSMWFRLKVKGKAAHGGTKYEGVSAIEKSITVIEQLKQLEKIRNDRIKDPLYKNTPIPIPINVGKISGGTWPSSVADLVILEGRCGIAPNEDILEAKKEVEKFLNTLGETDGWFKENPVDLEWFGARWLPNEMSSDHELVTLLKKEYKALQGEEAVIEASPWGTDGGLLSKAGGVPTVVFGPGETKVAHFPNEYIEIKKMIDTAKIMACLLIEWCGAVD